MRVFKLIKLNVKYSKIGRTLILIILFAALYSMVGIVNYTNVDFKFGTGDIFISLFGGVNAKVNSAMDYTNWMGFNIIMYFPIAIFLYNEMKDRTLIKLPKIKSYRAFYLSNIITAAIKLFLYLAIIYFIVFVCIILKYGYIDMTTPNILNRLNVEICFFKLILELFIINFLGIFTNVMIMVVIYLITGNFKYGCLGALVFDIITMFFSSDNFGISRYLLGNRGMLSRTLLFKDGLHGVTFLSSTIYFVFIIVILTIIGNYFCRNIIDR